MNHLAVKLVVVLLLMALPGIPSTERRKDCPETCDCEGTALACRILNGNYTSLILPKDTHSLDLSNTGLTRVPSELFAGLTKLQNLSLSRNNIAKIHVHAFKDLKNMTFLNLSHNDLEAWEGPFLQSDFPSLTQVDITSNTRWLPANLLNISTIQEIKGVTWSKRCKNCYLKRHNHLIPTVIPKNCNQAAKFYFLQFYPKCSDMENCKFGCGEEKVDYRETAKKGSSRRSLIYIAGYIVGSLAICANLVVLVNVFLSKTLRRDLSMNIVANMAVCDIMIGIHSIIMSKFSIYALAVSASWSQSVTEELKIPFCRVASVLMTTGEIVSVVASLLLTIEKYTCIVYCMKPDIRLKKKHVIIVMTTVWTVSLLFSLSPMYGFIKLKYSISIMCTMPTNHDESKPTFLIYPCALIFYNYLMMIPMYIHIFVVVNRSSNEMSIRRNAALAKKVLMMIGSNFVLFAVPMSLFVVFVVLHKGHTMTSVDRSLGFFIFYEFLPVILLGINSLMNPFLYAFRYRKFQKEFKRQMHVVFGGYFGVQLRRAYTAITTTNLSLSSPTSKTGGYKFDIPLDKEPANQQTIKRLHIPKGDLVITLRGVTNHNPSEGRCNGGM